MIYFADERSVIVKEFKVELKGREINRETGVLKTDAARQFDDSRFERQEAKVLLKCRRRMRYNHCEGEVYACIRL